MSHVAKMNIIQVILFIAINLDWPLMSLVVKNVFLYGELTKEVSMDSSSGFPIG